MKTKTQFIRPSHLRVLEGDLYSDKLGKWEVVRTKYEFHFREITKTAQFKACLRAGSHTSLGCYPLYFVTADGESLSFEAARENAHLIIDAIRNQDNTGGWCVIGCEVNWEDSELDCAHTGKHIESAYAD